MGAPCVSKWDGYCWLHPRPWGGAYQSFLMPLGLGWPFSRNSSLIERAVRGLTLDVSKLMIKGDLVIVLSWMA